SRYRPRHFSAAIVSDSRLTDRSAQTGSFIMSRKFRTVAAVTAAAAVALAGCSGSGDAEGADGGGGGSGDVQLTWWHNSNNEPGRGYYEQVAADFEADNPGVTISIEALEHEDMLTRLDAAFQTGDQPDIFMERGGGELADHVEAGLVMDITDAASETIETLGPSIAAGQVEDQVYALPFSLGVVGFWYNTSLFEEAGI